MKRTPPIQSAYKWCFLIGGVLSFFAFVSCSDEVSEKNNRQISSQKESQEPDPTENRYTIPFELTEANNIAVKAKLNDQNSLLLMFHTANHDVCLTKKAIESIKNLKLDQTSEVESWGGRSSTKFGSGHSLQIGDLKHKITIFQDQHSGPGTDGKFGPDFFKDFFVEIDFEKQQLILHQSLPKKATDFQELVCKLKHGSMFVTGKFKIGQKWIENDLMIHSGFGGTILLDDSFAKRNKLNDLPVIKESELKDSFGNVLKNRQVMVKEFALGTSQFSDFPIGYFDGALGKQKISVLGGEVLKRFHIILSKDRSKIYLKRNSLYQNGFESKNSKS